MRKTIRNVLLFLLPVMVFAMPQSLMAAQAGEELIHLDFDDGGLDGFTTYTNGGECELENTGGALAVHIGTCGKLDYANQAYWDGFSLEQNCEYTYSFDVSCEIERRLEYRLQLNGGDYHAYVGDFITVGPEMTHVSVDFTMTEETDPAPRLAFNMGLMTDMAQDPGPHTVWFDNISLQVKEAAGVSDEDAETDARVIGINQVGYLPGEEKTVFLFLGDQASPAIMPAQTFLVTDESGETVFEGTFEEPFYDEASGGMLQRGVFTKADLPGTYRICIPSGEAGSGADAGELISDQFVIGEDVYDDVFGDVCRMLTLQRCGDAAGLPSGPETEAFLHGSCHLSDALIYGTDETKEVSGGWHDAGDYGRYVVSGAKAAADLFQAYAWLSSRDEAGAEALLEEARYELDWMLKMQDEKTGGVYHKVTCRNFPGEVWPEEETEELVLSPVSAAATGDFAAVMAKASVLYRDTDPEFANQALDAALRAWEYEKTAVGEEKGFRNPPDISTGEYPDPQTEDEFFWAAAELYLAGAIDEAGVSERLSGVTETGFGWQSVAGYGLWDLALDSRESGTFSEAARKIVLQDVRQTADACEKDGYWMALGTEYPWGSNMSVANNGMKLCLAYQLTGEERYLSLAAKQRDYLLGANAAGYCYVTGEGSRSPEHPHHRPSQAAGAAMPGMLVGGPDSSLEDPYAQNVLQGKAPALCYADNAQSYSTNETAIYWNSPLIALLAYLSYCC